LLLGEDCHGLGVVARHRLSRPCVVGLVVKPVGKPDAGDPHVRFDERGWETGLRATAPILDSTGWFLRSETKGYLAKVKFKQLFEFIML